MDFITMYTVDKRVRISKEQWDSGRTILTIYNNRGYRAETTNGKTNHGVHRENLAKTREEAIEKREAVYKELFPSLYP